MKYRGWTSISESTEVRTIEVRGATKEYQCAKCGRKILKGEPYAEIKTQWSYEPPEKWCWNCYAIIRIPEMGLDQWEKANPQAVKQFLKRETLGDERNE